MDKFNKSRYLSPKSPAATNLMMWREQGKIGGLACDKRASFAHGLEASQARDGPLLRSGSALTLGERIG
jgi:hypothetical protein